MSRTLGEFLRPWSNWRNKSFWLLVIFVAVILFGFFVVPHLVERALVQTVENTGRSIEIADIQSNPFALSLRVSGLEIRDADGTMLTRLDEFYTNIQASSLFHWALTFADIRLLGLHVEEERFKTDETRWRRFANDLSGDLSPPPEVTSTTEQDKSPPRLIIQNLVIKDGSIGLTDQQAGGFHSEFGPVSVNVRNLTTLPDHSGENEVSIGMPAGGVVSWKGDLQVVPLASSGHFRVRGKGLPVVLRYADYYLPIGIEGENLELDFDYRLEMAEDGLAIRGENTTTRTGRIEARFDESGEVFVSLSRMDLEGGSWQFPERTMSADSFTIDGVALDISLDANGQLNLLDIIPEQGVSEPQPDNDEPDGASPWAINIEEVALTNASIEVEDQRLQTPARVNVENLNLKFLGVDNQPGTAIAAEISGQLASGGSYSYKGDITVLPALKLQGVASVSDLALPVLQPWLAGAARVDLRTGTMNLETEVSGSPPDTLLLAGSTGISNLEIRDTNRNQRLVGLETLDIERFEFDLAGQSVKTSAVDLKGAFGRIHIFEDLSTNIGDLVVESEEAQQPETESESGSLALTIAGIEIEDSSMDFSDDSLPLPFRALIGNLNGSLSTLSTNTSEPTRVEMEGQVNEFGQANISGTLSPWDFTQNTDIGMVFRNLQMSELTPYTIQYAGYAIESGRLDMDLGYKFQQRQLEGENKIVIRELELGDKVEHPDAVSLPLKLAVALLKDSEGVIDVDLPVSGDLDDPTFKISGVVWKAIGNLITKIVTSPFRFLGSLVGVDSEDFGTLKFQPGQSDISPPDREQLLKLAEAMQERPELELAITGVYVEELDHPALQTIAFDRQLEASQATLLESGQADVLAGERQALESLFTNAFPEITLESVQIEFSGGGEDVPQQEAVLDEPAYLGALRARLIAVQAINESELQTLASARAEAIVDALKSFGDSDSGISVTIATDVQAGEADQGSVLLELEVAVGDLNSETE